MHSFPLKLPLNTQSEIGFDLENVFLMKLTEFREILYL